MSTADTINHEIGERPADAALDSLDYVPSFDGVRAIACLTVFLENFHIEMQMRVTGAIGPLSLTRLAESGIGVALLIALSGTLLSVPFWRALVHRAGPVPLGAYALRRAVRLVPPYYACVLLLAIAGGAARDPLDLVAHLLFVNNLWEESFYGISPQFWTIGLFAQLYVVLPVLFAVLRRLATRPASAVMVVAALTLAAFLLHVSLMIFRATWLVWPLTTLATPDGYVLSHSTLAHLPHFLLGVISGYVLVKRTTTEAGSTASRSPLPEVVFWISALGLLFLSCTAAAARLEIPYGRYLFPWMPVLTAAALATLPSAPLASRVLGMPPLRWLGVISYGFYVYHVTCLGAVQRLMAMSGRSAADEKLLFAALSLGASIAVATASYWLLERPLRRALVSATRKRGVRVEAS